MQNKAGQGDIFAPLRRAAEKAREFAEKLMNSSVAFAREIAEVGDYTSGNRPSHRLGWRASRRREELLIFPRGQGCGVLPW